MNVDTQFQPLATIATPARSVHTPPGQVTQRPVERPHHSEPANNQERQVVTPAESDTEQTEHDKHPRTLRQASELSEDEKRELEKLKARDREVRAHEAAHKNAAGNLARGAAQFSYATGPDGRRYAVAGEVDIDTSRIAGDPEATISKAQTIRRAANAPAQPSFQDRAVAAEAGRLESAARQELIAEKIDQHQSETGHQNAVPEIYQANDSGSAPIGSLLDVSA